MGCSTPNVVRIYIFVNADKKNLETNLFLVSKIVSNLVIITTNYFSFYFMIFL